MGYVEENLIPGEQILHRANLHWGIFITPVIITGLGFLLIIIALVIGDESATACLCFGVPAILLGGLGLINAIASIMTSEFALTDKRIIAKVGFIRRQSSEMLLSKIESVSVDQPIMGRMLGYGTIVMTGSGGSKETFKNISNPMDLRRRAQHRISEM